MASFTTVGYGDLSPNTDNMRRFSLFFIALGVVLFPFLANQISRVLEIVTKKVSIESHLLTTLTVPLPSRHTCSLHVSRGTEPYRACEQHTLLFSQVERPVKRLSRYLSFKYFLFKYNHPLLCFCFGQSDEDPPSQPRRHSLADSVSSGSAQGEPPHWLRYWAKALLPGLVLLMRRTQVQKEKRQHLSWCHSLYALGTSRALFATGRTIRPHGLAEDYKASHTVPRAHSV